ncbi:unnamed protein product [Rhizoctonia solani]|uniref:VWFA domain-containing protein n=1 Tax=Rhizoctonia solani TaxID=456999 RepID=A0A8H2WX81_9AGAM|nr:unnamed protein product [Rhizoctonia solani]
MNDTGGQIGHPPPDIQVLDNQIRQSTGSELSIQMPFILPADRNIVSQTPESIPIEDPPHGVSIPQTPSELSAEKPQSIGQPPEKLTDLSETNTPNPTILPELGIQDDVPWFDAQSAIDSDETQNDVLCEIPSMHRLLDLVYETGSAGQGGLVEKIIIDQNSLGALLNRVLPGSYRSISSIDFKSLDAITIKPKGVYGSRSEIARFLMSIQVINDSMAQLLTQSGDESTSNSPNLRSGLYAVFPPDQLGSVGEGASQDVFIVYWPEDTTWSDEATQAIQRNRVIFMRYLTQLSDQIVCLVSVKEAELFVWDSGTRNPEAPVVDSEEEEDDDARMFTFEVKKSEDQEENVTASEGFKVEPHTKLTSGKHVELVGGETGVGLLLSSSEEPREIKESKTELYSPLRLKNLLLHNRVVLGKHIDDGARSALEDNGLKEKYPQLFARYESEIYEAEKERDREVESEIMRIGTRLEEEQSKIEQCLRNIARQSQADFKRYLDAQQMLTHSSEVCMPSLDNYPLLVDLDRESRRHSLAQIDCQKFQDLKPRIVAIREDFLKRPCSSEEQHAIIEKFRKEPLHNLTSNRPNARKTSSPSGWKVVTGVFSGSDSKSKEAIRPAQGRGSLGDLDFLRDLGEWAKKYPVLNTLKEELLASLEAHLASLEETFVDAHLAKIVESAKRTQEGNNKRTQAQICATRIRSSWDKLWGDINAAASTKLEPEPGDLHLSSTLKIESLGMSRESNKNTSPMWHLQTTRITSIPPRTRYSYYPLQLKRDEARLCQTNSLFIPQPVISSKPEFNFWLEPQDSIKLIRIINDKCLIIVASDGVSYIFMNRFLEIEDAIKHRSYKNNFKHERLGDEPVYAYDEITRTLAVCHCREHEDIYITWFVFNETHSNLKRHGGFSFSNWYDKHVQIQHMCFVTGSAEVCLVDSVGTARILSLVSEQFGPASLDVGTLVQNAFSAPDGSCLLLATEGPETHEYQLRAYHWSSFGRKLDGYHPTSVRAGSSYAIMSFDRRGPTHLVSMDPLGPYNVNSTALWVKQKSAKFDFKSKESQATTANKKIFNNCLMDCHMEVWSRFPVHPAVLRNNLAGSIRKPPSITFVTEGDFGGAKAYFSKLVSTFERTTQKPTNGKLFEISVEWSHHPLERAIQVAGSSFQFGSFVAELICLIPIQLAVTRENGFIPLKDGILNPAFERQLLGADVPAIINSISVGWYESLFQSYMATKPVRVVSSMGEQSVGKSYCLNHFADTSFAGSAMRTTEGVWLSCTPTDDYLLVCLDFEGVQSIERSAQEDTLLVLFNAAISNMVLFRNNFAISRNIAGLFKSFQSSAMVLDPQLNPGLFNSDLAIIIKDVVHTDTKDIVREFSQKFQDIVWEEQDQNFITRLHRGQLHIMPWPVIKSRNFYTLFQRLRDCLERQQFTHNGGGVFLHTLKTLMAKIKANDWGALDQNLAAHRAQQLAEYLPDAISRGSVQLDQDLWLPMKNLDTDEDIPYEHPVSSEVYWVPRSLDDHTSHGSTSAESLLAELTRLHTAEHIERRNMNEEQYVADLQARLHHHLDIRVEQVRCWVTVNTARFPQENQDIRNIFKAVDNIVVATRVAVQLCASKCSSCHLLCLNPYRHSVDIPHNCGTDHSCASLCEVKKEHPEPTRCGLPAGHDGYHLCKAGEHTCGQQCSLHEKTGCEVICVKEIGHHADHLCSARAHFCGRPCDLKDANQHNVYGAAPSYSCFGTCQAPWDEVHERHACGNAHSCPMTCRLCPRLCCDTDHFHGLKPDSVHLCGQEHACMMPCEAPGICQIETQPSAILERFTGRFEAFQYTRYSQEKRRLLCAIPIAPGKLCHEGAHIHSTAEVVFHFCDVQCPRCKYYCTLPLGHPQQQHDTSHGSMTETRWLIDGPTSSASYDLQDHKYGIGDQGSTVLCSLICSQQGRHVHVDYCRHSNASECEGEECQHIKEQIFPRPDLPKDWISHRLYWQRSGFKDPYARNEQLEFAKCDAYCSAQEHKATSTTPATPSYCKLPVLHEPVATTHVPSKTGYLSPDGHIFECKDPAQVHQVYHIVFVIDSSSSMTQTDRQPLPNTPATSFLRENCNNRYGAVLSALHSFWKSREVTSPMTGSSARGDSYSIITFSNKATRHTSNDTSSSPEHLLFSLVPQQTNYGTDFEAAIEEARGVVQENWNNTRAPVVIFLSDGAGQIADESISRLCDLCMQLGTPLQFYTILFGREKRSTTLKQMAQVALRAYQAARPGRRNTRAAPPCAYESALDSVELASRFLDISNSLQKPRAALIGSSNNRLQGLTRQTQT